MCVSRTYAKFARKQKCVEKREEIKWDEFRIKMMLPSSLLTSVVTEDESGEIRDDGVDNGNFGNDKHCLKEERLFWQ